MDEQIEDKESILGNIFSYLGTVIALIIIVLKILSVIDITWTIAILFSITLLIIDFFNFLNNDDSKKIESTKERTDDDIKIVHDKLERKIDDRD